MHTHSSHHRRDGDDEDKKNKKASPPSNTPGPEAGDYNLGDDAGTRVGQGHDPIEDPIA